MISIENLQVKYGSICALDVAGTHSFPDGAIVAVLGSNGAGKSTFINTLLGEVAHAGSASGIDPRHTSVQFQTNSYNPLMQVGELCRLVGVSATSSDLASSFRIEQLLKKRMGALSGGERQRVTLFLVLAQSAPVYIFDELTTGLDFQTRESLMNLVHKKTKDTTVFITSHYFEEVEGWASHCLILDKGRPLFVGEVSDFLHEHPHCALIKVRTSMIGQGLLQKDLCSMPWESEESFLVAHDRDEQVALTTQLSQDQIPFGVLPCGLSSCYTLAMSTKYAPKGEVA